MTEQQKQEKKTKKKPTKKSQSQILQESLGLPPEAIKSIEEKLFLARFTDYFSENAMDFIYKDKQLDGYKNDLTQRINALGEQREEDKLIKKSFESKHIIETLYRLKGNAEALARQNRITQPFDKKMRKYSLATTIPMFGLLILLTFLNTGSNFYFILFPLLCVFCLVPQIIRGRIMKQWFQFKEAHQNEFYTQNRGDLMILKGFTSDVLGNIRSSLLEMKIPLQLIKFVLYSRDYENVTMITQKRIKGGGIQYFFHFEYPEGMEPFPIPEALKQQALPVRSPEKAEKNFIALTEMKGTAGVIQSFVPTLKDNKADKINEILNNSEFRKPTKTFKEIIPNYSESLAIYCKCGEIARIEDVHVGSWKNQFDFYLFEAESCNCGEKVYALSLMDENERVPDEFKDIFKD